MGRPVLSRPRARATRVQPKLKVWVVFGSRVKFGDGRARLLELVDELGSLRQAVDRVGMSYRAAWGYFRELERASGVRLLEPIPGGPRAGTRLTAEARALVSRFRRFQAGIDTNARRSFARAFDRSGTTSKASRRSNRQVWDGSRRTRFLNGR